MPSRTLRLDKRCVAPHASCAAAHVFDSGMPAPPRCSLCSAAARAYQSKVWCVAAQGGGAMHSLPRREALVAMVTNSARERAADSASVIV